jgi:hypothetical protein
MSVSIEQALRRASDRRRRRPWTPAGTDRTGTFNPYGDGVVHYKDEEKPPLRIVHVTPDEYRKRNGIV